MAGHRIRVRRSRFKSQTSHAVWNWLRPCPPLYLTLPSVEKRVFLWKYLCPLETWWHRKVPFGRQAFKVCILLSWQVWLRGLSTSLQTKGLLVQFPVRAHNWVVGQAPSGGHMRGNHTLMFLSLSSSLPSPLSKINK